MCSIIYWHWRGLEINENRKGISRVPGLLLVAAFTVLNCLCLLIIIPLQVDQVENTGISREDHYK